MATLLIWAILFLLGTNVSAPAAELTKLRVGILIAGEFSPTFIAQKKGFFEKNGLSVDLVYFQGGSQAIQGMMAGNVPLIVTAGPEGVVAKIQGAGVHPLRFSRYKEAGRSAWKKGWDQPLRFLFGSLDQIYVPEARLDGKRGDDRGAR